MRQKYLLIALSLTLFSPAAFARTRTGGLQAPRVDAKAADASAEKSSPWLLAPVFSVNPKLGISVGALVGYLHYFDAKSRPSIFAISGQYTDTDSTVAGALARTSYDEDRQRLVAGLVHGYVRNDYSDYLGTGAPLKSNADLRAFISRYLYRVKGNWFAGAQGVYQNMTVSGETAYDDMVLDVLGVRPFKSAGLGAVAYYDSRDDENMPTKGWVCNINNMAYRKSLGGEENYDAYRSDIRYFYPHGKRNVFAVRQMNQFTDDAPVQAQAPVQLRGYKVGQYNGKNMSHIEGEERWRLADKWTGTVFAGLACTYGDGKSCSDGENLFAAAGAGVQYILKAKEGIVINSEYAHGEGSNYGFYMKMGYAY